MNQLSEIIEIEPYSVIYSKLQEGEENALPVSAFCIATGMRDRALRKHIEYMRKCGLCILSCQSGYYLPATEEELQRYIARTEKAARSLFFSLRSARRALRKFQARQQLSIEEA